MHLSKAIAVGIAIILPITLTSSILEGRQNDVTCQTSSGSPLTGDVTAAINQLNEQGGDCSNENSEALDQIQQTCLNEAADDPSTLTENTYTISASLKGGGYLEQLRLMR
ncbi:MAG: hypothetical protein Q9161_008978 [Pseudevernia consocians]